MIDMQPIESSNIAATGYDPDTGTLRIQFKNGGTYDYEEVAPDAFEALMTAESPGKALRGIIDGRRYTKIDPEAG